MLKFSRTLNAPASLSIVVALVACRNHEREEAQLRDLLFTANRQVRMYAYEAWPSWQRSHPDQACPSIAALHEYVERVPLADPWGHPYRVLCADQVPAEARGLGVTSPGPDGDDGTADDIRSWDPID